MDEERRGARRAPAVAGLVAAGFVIFCWIGFSLGFAIEWWSDQCVSSDTRCERGAGDKVFAGIQLLIPLAGAYLAWRRRWWLFTGTLLFWILVPMMLMSLTEA